MPSLQTPVADRSAPKDGPVAAKQPVAARAPGDNVAVGQVVAGSGANENANLFRSPAAPLVFPSGMINRDELSLLWQLYDPAGQDRIDFATLKDLVRDIYSREVPGIKLNEPTLLRATCTFQVLEGEELKKIKFFELFPEFWAVHEQLLSGRPLPEKSQISRTSPAPSPSSSAVPPADRPAPPNVADERNSARWRRRSYASTAGSTVLSDTVDQQFLAQQFHAPQFTKQEQQNMQLRMAFEKGDIYQALSWLDLREQEDLESPEVRLLPPRSKMELLKLGVRALTRIFVRVAEGQEGWVSVVDPDGQLLVGPTQTEPDYSSLCASFQDAILAGADGAAELVAAHQHAVTEAEVLWRCEAEMRHALRAAQEVDFGGRDMAVEELCADVTNKLRGSIMGELIEAQQLRSEAAEAADEATRIRVKVVGEEKAAKEQLEMSTSRDKHMQLMQAKQEVLEGRIRVHERDLERQLATEMAFRQEALDGEESQVAAFKRQEQELVQETLRAAVRKECEQGEERTAELEREAEMDRHNAQQDRQNAQEDRQRTASASEQAQMAAHESLAIYNRAIQDRERAESLARQATLDLENSAAHMQGIARNQDNQWWGGAEVHSEVWFLSKRLEEETRICQAVMLDRDRLKRELRDLSRARRAGK